MKHLSNEQIMSIIKAIVVCIITIASVVLGMSACTASMSISKYNNAPTHQSSSQSANGELDSIKLKL